MSMFRLRAGAVVLFSVLSLNTFAAELESVEERFSYVLGVQFGQELVKQGIQVDGDAFAAALNDVMWGKPLRLSVDEMREALQPHMDAQWLII